MTKLIALGLALASLILNVLADPVFISSSKRINDISRSLFFDTDSFNGLVDEKLLARESLPENIFLFDVKLTNKKYIENPSLLLKEVVSHPSLQNNFAPSENTFSSVYIKEAFSPVFTEKILKTIQNAGDYEVIQSNLAKFNRMWLKNADKKVVRVTKVPVVDFGTLDTVLSEIKRSNISNLVILKFTDESASIIPQALIKLETNERVLQDQPVANPNNTGAQGNTKAVGTGVNAIGISPAGLTGYVISIILLIGVYIGFQVMQDIKGPIKFYKDNLQIGKEQ